MCRTFPFFKSKLNSALINVYHEGPENVLPKGELNLIQEVDQLEY